MNLLDCRTGLSLLFSLNELCTSYYPCASLFMSLYANPFLCHARCATLSASGSTKSSTAPWPHLTHCTGTVRYDRVQDSHCSSLFSPWHGEISCHMALLYMTVARPPRLLNQSNETTANSHAADVPSPLLSSPSLVTCATSTRTAACSAF